VKKIFLFIAFIIIVVITNAQSTNGQIDSTSKNFEKFKNIPAFNVYVAPDSTGFSNKNLSTKKALIIMFFDPSCEHCQKEMKEFMAYKKELKNTQILMVTPSSYKMIKEFYKDYEIATMPNIKIGQDVKYTLGSIYQVRTFPSMFIYSKTRHFVKSFVGNASVPSILQALK